MSVLRTGIDSQRTSLATEGQKVHEAGLAYAKLRIQRTEDHLLPALEAWLTFKQACIGEVVYGVSVPAPEVGGLCRGRRSLTLPLAGASSCSWPAGSPQTVLAHFFISHLSALLWVPFNCPLQIGFITPPLHLSCKLGDSGKFFFWPCLRKNTKRYSKRINTNQWHQ